MRPGKYHVTLTEEEYKQLLELVSKGKAAAQKVRNAEILLALDETFNENPSTIEGIWTVPEKTDNEKRCLLL